MATTDSDSDVVLSYQHSAAIRSNMIDGGVKDGLIPGNMENERERSEHRKVIVDMGLSGRVEHDLDDPFYVEENKYSRNKRRYEIITMLILWIACLLLGMFYFRESSCCEHRYGLSFYMAVNVFYSIGWTHPTNDSEEIRYFSSFYLSVGAVFIVGAITYFIDIMIEENMRHYADIIALEEAMERTISTTKRTRARTWTGTGDPFRTAELKTGTPSSQTTKTKNVSFADGLESQQWSPYQGNLSDSGRGDGLTLTALSDLESPVRSNGTTMFGDSHSTGILLRDWGSDASRWFLRFIFTYSSFFLDFLMLFAWVLWGITFGVVVIEWTFSEALYFSLSTLSGGGMYSVPEESTDVAFALAGVFAATGIPIAGMVIGNVVKAVIERLGRDKMAAYLSRKIDDAEFEILKTESINPTTARMDISKFLLLVFVRQRVVDMRLVDVVLNRVRRADALTSAKFKHLDISYRSSARSRQSSTSTSASQRPHNTLDEFKSDGSNQ